MIVRHAHDYGLHWYEQTINKSGQREWIKHLIDPLYSQYYTMEWADIGTNGKMELITRKRYRVHNGAIREDTVCRCFNILNGMANRLQKM